MTDEGRKHTKYEIHIKNSQGIVIGDKGQVTQQRGSPEDLRFGEKLEMPSPPFQFVRQTFPPFVNMMAEIKELHNHLALCLKSKVAQ